MIKGLRIIRNKKWIEILLHVAGWMLFLTLPYILRSNRMAVPKRHLTLPPAGFPPMEPEHFNVMHYEPMIFNLLMIPLFYMNIAYLIPRLFLKRKYAAFFALQIGIVIVLNFISNWLHTLLTPEMPGMKMGIPIFLYILTTSFAVCYCLVRKNIDDEQKQKERENESLKSELLFLRWQISPHFMFNALNNMVALSRVKSDKLEPMLIRLSTLMRYMLYDTDEKRVSIHKEIEYLQSYIDLQSIRFGSELDITCDIQVQDDVNVLIEPMLLIPFVENAFKHGTGIVAKPFIHLLMNVSNEKLSFSIRNRFVPALSKDDEQAHGIGLINVRRRLNLLYGDNFTLDILENEDLFVINLNIYVK